MPEEVQLPEGVGKYLGPSFVFLLGLQTLSPVFSIAGNIMATKQKHYFSFREKKRSLLKPGNTLVKVI